MDFLAQVVVWLNAIANAVGRLLFAPISVLPGWGSATIVAAVTGVALLVVFKYTSNQRAIKRTRDNIKANLLALKLFKESASVALHAQGSILAGAFWLLIYAIVPLLVMIVPVLLILGQLTLWYESRPLQVGEETIMTLKLNCDTTSPWPEVQLQPIDAVEVNVGPVRVLSKGEVCWNIRARHAGYHRLAFDVAGEAVNKELAVGDSFMRVSAQRPAWSWSDILLHPSEQPFRSYSAVQSIEIDYPERDSWTSGVHFRIFGVSSWVIYWFVVSLVAGFCFRGVLSVNI
jgi:hypothetical protein